MSFKGIFVFIDDNIHEHTFFKKAVAEICENEVKSAYDGEQGLEVIKKNKDNIFIIFCDVNMPKMNGLELKRVIEGTPELKIKSIPFIFHSTQNNAIVVKEAYTLGIQGFLKKSDDMNKSIPNLDIIVKLWSAFIHPNSLGAS